MTILTLVQHFRGVPVPIFWMIDPATNMSLASHKNRLPKMKDSSRLYVYIHVALELKINQN